MANRLSLAFDILARDRASRELEKPGEAAQRTADKVEKGSSRAGKAFGLLGKTFASSSAGALGPLQELTDKFEVFSQATEEGGSKAGGRLLGIGLAATAAGSFLESLHSREQGAQQQLQTSIEATGHSYENYAAQIEKAVKSGEHFGDQSSVTMDALNRLTVTTHSPEEALKGLSAAFDVAAEKHVSLAKASEIVGLVFNGSTKAGKQFGLTLENTTGAAKALTSAQAANASAVKASKDAQTAFNEKQAEWNASSKHTLAQAYALRDAHTRMLEAQDKVSASAARLKTAQEKAAAAAGAGERNVAKLTALHGQAAAQADTFTGRLKAMGAQLEDTLGANGKVGGTLVTVGVLASGIGALASAGLFSKLGSLISRLGTTGGAFKTLRDVEIATSQEGAAGVVAGTAETEAALGAEGAAAEGAAAKFGLLRGSMFALGPAAVVAVGALRVINDASKGNLTRKDLSSNQDMAFLAARDLLTVKGKSQQHILDLLKQNNAADLAAVLEFLKANPNATDYVPGGKVSTAQSAAIVAMLTKMLAGMGLDPSGKSFGIDAPGTGVNSDNPNIATHAANAINNATAKSKTAAAKGGKDTGDSFLNGLLKQLSGQDAQATVNKAAQNAAQLLVDSAQQAFSTAQSRLQSLVSASLSLRQSVTSALEGGSALTDIFQGPDLNANGAFGKQNNFGRIRDFLQKRVAQERRFVLELRALIRQGLDPSLVAQIASAGVDGGQRIAEGILSGGKGGIGQVNSLERQIASLANTTGKTVADDHYAKQIAAQRHNTEVLGHKLDVANSHLAQIQNGTGGSSSSASLRTNAALSGL